MPGEEFVAFRGVVDHLVRLARSEFQEGELEKLRYVIQQHREQGETLESYYMLPGDTLEPPALRLLVASWHNSPRPTRSFRRSVSQSCSGACSTAYTQRPEYASCASVRTP